MIELVDTGRAGVLTRLDRLAEHLLTTRDDCKQTCTRRASRLKGSLVKITVQRPDAAKVHLQLTTGCLGCKPAADGAHDHAAGSASAGTAVKPPLPPHVQVTYTLRNCDLESIVKTYDVTCPDCGLRPMGLPSQAEVQQFIRNHAADTSSRNCTQLLQLLDSGAYSNAAAYGAVDPASGKPELEPFVEQIFARVFMLMALHIVTVTDTAAGAAKKAAAATTGDESVAMLQPWRKWAISILSENVDLLDAANWVRPSLHSLKLAHKPSLLDLLLALPYVAVAEPEAGKRQLLEKLSALLYGAVEQQGMGLQGSVAAAAAVAFVLPELLSKDPVFGPLPEDQRLQEFLHLTGISDTDEIAIVMTEPFISDHLEVCAVCGLEAKTLAKSHKAAAAAAVIKLHKCSYCLVSVCGGCKGDMDGHGQSENDVTNSSSNGWPSGLCPWCQDHPDTEGFVPPPPRATAAAAAKGAAAGKVAAAAAAGSDAAAVPSKPRRGRPPKLAKPPPAAAAAEEEDLSPTAEAAVLSDTSRSGPWHRSPVDPKLLDADAAVVGLTAAQQEVLLNRRSRHNNPWRVVYEHARVDLPDGYVMIEVQLASGRKYLPIYYAPDGMMLRSRNELNDYYNKQQQQQGLGSKQGVGIKRRVSEGVDGDAGVAAAAVSEDEMSKGAKQQKVSSSSAAASDDQQQQQQQQQGEEVDGMRTSSDAAAVLSDAAAAAAAARPKRQSAAMADVKIHEQQMKQRHRRKSAPTTTGSETTAAAAAGSRPTSAGGAASESETAAAAPAAAGSSIGEKKRRGRPPKSITSKDTVSKETAQQQQQQQQQKSGTSKPRERQGSDSGAAAAVEGTMAAAWAAAAAERELLAAAAAQMPPRPDGRPHRRAAVKAAEKVHGWTHEGVGRLEAAFSSDLDDISVSGAQAESESESASEVQKSEKQQQQPAAAADEQKPAAAAAAGSTAATPAASAAAAAADPKKLKAPQGLQAMLAAAAANKLAAAAAPRPQLLPASTAVARFGAIPISGSPAAVGFSNCGPFLMLSVPQVNAAAMAAAAAAAAAGRLPQGVFPRSVGITVSQAAALAAATSAAAAAARKIGSTPPGAAASAPAASVLPKLPAAVPAAASAAATVPPAAASVKPAASDASTAAAPTAAVSAAAAASRAAIDAVQSSIDQQQQQQQPVVKLEPATTATPPEQNDQQQQQQQQKNASLPQVSAATQQQQQQQSLNTTVQQAIALLAGRVQSAAAASAADSAAGSPAVSSNDVKPSTHTAAAPAAAAAASAPAKPGICPPKISVSMQIAKEAAAAAKAVAAVKKAHASQASPATAAPTPAATPASTAAAAAPSPAPAAAAAVVVKVSEPAPSPATVDAADILSSLGSFPPEQLGYQRRQQQQQRGSSSNGLQPQASILAAAAVPAAAAAAPFSAEQVVPSPPAPPPPPPAAAAAASDIWDAATKLDLIEVISRLGFNADLDIVHSALTMLGRQFTRSKVEQEMQFFEQQMESMAKVMGKRSLRRLSASESEQLFEVVKQHQRKLVAQARKQQQQGGGLKRKAEELEAQQQQQQQQRVKRERTPQLHQQQEEEGAQAAAAAAVGVTPAPRQQQQQHSVSLQPASSSRLDAAAAGAAVDSDSAAEKARTSIQACVVLLKLLPGLPQDVYNFLIHIDARSSDLYNSYKQSKDMSVVTQLQVLLKVISAVVSLEGDQKSEFVQCLSQLVPEGYGPAGSSCKTLDLLIHCWEKEADLSGCTVEAAVAAAAAGPLAAAYANDYVPGSPGLSLNCFVAGMCELVLQFLQGCCRSSSSAAAAGFSAPALAVEVLSGTAVLLLHWPSGQACFAERCFQAGLWRQKLLEHGKGQKLADMQRGVQGQLQEFLVFLARQAATQP